MTTKRDTAPESPSRSFAAVIALRRMADRMEREAVDRAIAEGWSWQQIAQELGVTRQAAHKRHAARIRQQQRHPPEDAG